MLARRKAALAWREQACRCRSSWRSCSVFKEQKQQQLAGAEEDGMGVEGLLEAAGLSLPQQLGLKQRM